MSLTAILWLALYCLAICASFVNPLFGMIGYLHEYYNRPELRWWGDELPILRWNLIISIAFGVSFILLRSSLPKVRTLRNWGLWWLVVLNVIMVFVTMIFALDRAVSWDQATQWTKMAIIIPMLLVGVIRTRSAFNAFAATHMVGGFWWGWDSWQNPHREAGRLMRVGSGDTQNDNAASAHLLTILPFIAVYLFTEKNKWLRLIALIAAPFVINTIILCNSRGSMVGILAALLSTVFLVRKGYRTRLIGVGIVTAALFLVLADQQFLTRQQTTANYQQDGSAQQRIESWQAGIRLVKDHPFGTGGKGFHFLSPRYIPSIVEAHGGELRAPHNTWVMVASEWGVLGFIAYLGIYASAFRMLSKVRAAAHGQDFYYWRAFAIQTALIAYLVASTFTDRLYAEAGYWMCGLAYALGRMQLTEQAAQTEATSAVDVSKAALVGLRADGSASAA